MIERVITAMRMLMARLTGISRRRSADDELNAEITSHLDALAADYMRRGLSAGEARAAARRDFGGVEQTKEAYRDQRGLPIVEWCAQDLRHAVRSLRKSPGFAAIAITTLALAIGATTAIFSVVRGVLIEPLAYTRPGELVLVQADSTVSGAPRALPINYSRSEFAIWNTLTSLDAPAFYVDGQSLLSDRNGHEILDTATVSGNFFATLSGPFAAGRPLQASDDAAPVVVISERLARRLFATPEEALGRTLTLTAQLHTIVGVAAQQLQFPSGKTDLWLPSGFMQSVNPRCCRYNVIARLREGRTLQQAAPEAEATAKAINPAARNTIHARVVRLADQIVANVERPLTVLFAAILLVLVVACINLVNLFLARNAARRQELMVRLALGASHGRLLVASTLESLLLAVAGTIAGFGIARLMIAGVLHFASEIIPRLDLVRLDLWTIAFGGGLALLAALATGAAPAWLSTRAIAHAKFGATRTASGQPHQRLRRALCMAECAVSFVLVVGATLLGRSLVNLLNTDLGVTTDHVLTASVNLGFGQPRPTDAQTRERIDRIVGQLAALPGVRAAAAGSALPPNESRIRITLRRDGDFVDYTASGVPVTPGYFSVMQMRLVKGRFFTPEDDANHPEATILTEETAKRFFPDDDPIGKTMTLPVLKEGKNASAAMTVVGVVSNVKYAGLAVPSEDVVYRPFAQQPWFAPYVAVRTLGDPDRLSGTLQKAIAAVDPPAVVSSVKTLERAVADAVAQPRFQTLLLAAFAGLGVAIAAVGLYGVIAYSVAQRTSEIGVRMALGAEPRRVRMMVLREGLAVGAAGVVAGIVSATAVVRALRGLLYGVKPADPMSFAAASLGLLVVSVAASYLPARKASRVDPMVALRAD